ncbi:uncharacterized protein LOC112575090 isoform X1 [Pomacea canaliculata]|uniref:uncharacterized protein LOC112575090 isoform X1 n=2 Tax=Pomacea canaliculata TaxID=400727 RepID=UPI000D7307CB|nr:uncharacterized protein LOC112575090 isoform X1 [Pomacea canaliculata]
MGGNKVGVSSAWEITLSEKKARTRKVFIRSRVLVVDNTTINNRKKRYRRSERFMETLRNMLLRRPYKIAPWLSQEDWYGAAGPSEEDPANLKTSKGQVRGLPELAVRLPYDGSVLLPDCDFKKTLFWGAGSIDFEKWSKILEGKKSEVSSSKVETVEKRSKVEVDKGNNHQVVDKGDDLLALKLQVRDDEDSLMSGLPFSPSTSEECEESGLQEARATGLWERAPKTKQNTFIRRGRFGRKKIHSPFTGGKVLKIIAWMLFGLCMVALADGKPLDNDGKSFCPNTSLYIGDVYENCREGFTEDSPCSCEECPSGKIRDNDNRCVLPGSEKAQTPGSTRLESTVDVSTKPSLPFDKGNMSSDAAHFDMKRQGLCFIFCSLCIMIVNNYL